MPLIGAKSVRTPKPKAKMPQMRAKCERTLKSKAKMPLIGAKCVRTLKPKAKKPLVCPEHSALVHAKVHQRALGWRTTYKFSQIICKIWYLSADCATMGILLREKWA